LIAGTAARADRNAASPHFGQRQHAGAQHLALARRAPAVEGALLERLQHRYSVLGIVKLSRAP